MARARISAGKSLVNKKKSKITFERIVISINLLVTIVLLLKVCGVI